MIQDARYYDLRNSKYVSRWQDAGHGPLHHGLPQVPKWACVGVRVKRDDGAFNSAQLVFEGEISACPFLTATAELVRVNWEHLDGVLNGYLGSPNEWSFALSLPFEGASGGNELQQALNVAKEAVAHAAELMRAKNTTQDLAYAKRLDTMVNELGTLERCEGYAVPGRQATV